MSCKWLGLTALIFVLASTLFFGFTHGADPPKAAAPAEGQFTGKVLVVSSKSSADFATQVENAQFKRLGGELFLTGTAFDEDEGGAWSNGRSVWIAMNDISQIVEFADRTELKKADEKLKPAQNATALRPGTVR